ncbi:ribonuclease H-like domain-containing protein, partial [Tanacetum coccineum]
IGYTVDRCFELVGYLVGYVKKNFNANTRHVSSNNASASADVHSNNVSRNNATTSNFHVSLSNEQLSRLTSLLNDNGVSTTNVNMAGKSFNFLMVVFKFNLNFKRYFNGNTTFLTGNLSLRWIVDSGENQHMIVSTKFLLNVVEISNLGLTVGHPNGTQALITKISDLKINNDITLYDVLVIPKYIVSVLSVHKLARDTVWVYTLKRKDDVYDSIEELPLYLWSEYILTAVYIINRIPSYVLSGKSPFSLVYGHGHLLSHFRVFGCLCYATILNNQDKFSSKSEKYVFIGNLEQTVFDYGVTKDLYHKNLCDNENPKRPNDEGRESSNDDGTELNPEFQGNGNSEATSIEENNTHPEGNVSDETDFVGDFYENSEFKSEVKDLPVNTVRRVVNYANLSHENFCFDSSLNKSVESTCYKDVILNNNWTDTMNAKIEALNKNHTWIITDLSANRKPIGSKWIFKIKYRENGEIERYKARLVVKDFNQREEIDFDETFTLVVKISTIRCFIALSVKNKWHLFQLGVNNAFLYGDLEEDVYMTIP